MKKFCVFLTLTLFLCTCVRPPKNKVIISDPQRIPPASGKLLTIDYTLSAICWKGYKPIKMNFGILRFKRGELYIEDNQLVGGVFIIDMNSIICENIIDKNKNEKYIQYLKSPDFFDTKKYPEGKFVITKSRTNSFGFNYLDVSISGNLELKGITKNITFNAIIKKKNNVFLSDFYKAKSQYFSIDRTKWKINHVKKNIVKGFKNSLCYHDIGIYVEIVAKPD